jgi:hypothetical protein
MSDDLKARLRRLNHTCVEQRTGEKSDVGKEAADALDARDAEIARLREALGGLHDALGLRRDDHELRRDYGELGLDWIKRARAALNGGSYD